MAEKTNKVNTSFAGEAAEYDPVNAYWLANCAYSAYERSKKLKSRVIDEWGFDNFTFIKRGETQCFIASTDKFVVVTFRGTETDKVEDIITDLDTGMTKGYKGKIHKGFKQAYNKVKAPIELKLADHKAQSKALWLAGHSLGGALATLAAYDLKEKGYKVSGVYTIGQPRVGNKSFTRAFDSLLKNRCFRFAHKDDKVPQIPLKELGYDHAGKAIYILSHKRLALKYKRSNNILNDLKSLGNSLSAHSSEKYLAAVKKNINNNPFTANNSIAKEKPLLKIDKEIKEVSKAAGKKANKVIKDIGKVFK